MHKCLKILFGGKFSSNFLRAFIQSSAKKYALEGVAQMHNDESLHVSIVVCGRKENVDSFLDVLHVNAARYGVENIEVEPFLKDKDYRGVFRVIE